MSVARPPESIVVAAAVVERDEAFLMTRRLAGSHLEGCWEFPGGKQQPDESLEECLARELLEELACDVEIGERIVTTAHAYVERHVTLHFYACRLRGEPSPQDGQEMRWVPREGLADLQLPEADRVLVELLTRASRP